MSKIEDVKRAYIDNSKRRSKSLNSEREIDSTSANITDNLTQPQTSDNIS